MKIKIIVLLVMALTTHLTANAQKSIKQFSFMLGNWEMKSDKKTISEHWQRNKETLVGKSYKHAANGNKTLTESVVLSLVNNVFTFSVTGYEKDNTGTTHFQLISDKDSTFIFENKKHDFPQRIVYQKKDKDHLLAWIEGEMNGKPMKISFPYQRKK